MSDPKFTHGPWTAEFTKTRGVWVNETEGSAIAVLCHYKEGDVDANAHLIAGAPELYEALKDLSDMYAHTWDQVDGALVMLPPSIPRFEAAHKKAQEALAKARGES